MQAPAVRRCLTDAGDRFSGIAFRGAVAAPRKELTPRIRTSAYARPLADASTEEEHGSPEEIAFLEFALSRARQTLQSYRLAPLVRRLPACLRALRVDSLQAARETLEARPDLTATALDSLLIGATSFYRDAQVFDYVRETALPWTFASQKRVRILSAACSDGAELYTVAALVDQLGRLSDADLWGIDCRQSAIDDARAGRYSETALAQFPECLRSAYFDPASGQVQVREKLVSSANWTVHNALFASQLGRWNVIFCRNLAIYLRPATSATLWRNLAGSLEPGGYLVVGRAEKPHVPGLLRVGPCTYRKES